MSIYAHMHSVVARLDMLWNILNSMGAQKN